MNQVENGLGNRFVEKYYNNYNVQQQYERLELSDSEFINILMEWSENKFTEEKLKFIYADLFTENKETTAILPALKGNYKLVLLSNTNFIHQTYGWEKYSFLNNFDKLILSHEVGFTKPDKNIYKAVEHFTQENSENHIFIDDIAEYVLAAQECGWQAIQFTSHEKLIADFQTLDIIIK